MAYVFDDEFIARAYRRELLNQGREEGLEKALRNLISATGWTIERAMTSLGIPETERPAYRRMLQEERS